MLKISAKLLLASSILGGGVAHADTSRWLPIGSTDSTCSFTATLEMLEGYPFARLLVGDSRIPMVVRQDDGCRSVSYTQAPAPLDPPTFEVSGVDLCMGRLPTYSVVRSLSGVSETCEIFWQDL